MFALFFFSCFFFFLCASRVQRQVWIAKKAYKLVYDNWKRKSIKAVNFLPDYQICFCHLILFRFLSLSFVCCIGWSFEYFSNRRNAQLQFYILTDMAGSQTLSLSYMCCSYLCTEIIRWLASTLSSYAILWTPLCFRFVSSIQICHTSSAQFRTPTHSCYYFPTYTKKGSANKKNMGEIFCKCK